MQSDGYSAYARYAKKTGITHAQCWAHSRRKIYDARDIEPVHADQALDAIAALYKVEQQIRDDGLKGQAKHTRRLEQSIPVLERFFAWIVEQFDKKGFLPSSPFFGALAYIRARRVGLSVYLDDRRYRSTRTTSSALCGSFRWVKRTGYSAGLSWAPGTSALYRACWRPIGCTRSIRTTTSSTCCNSSVSTRRRWCIRIRHGSGRRCLPTIRNGRTCITWMDDLLAPPRDRLLLSCHMRWINK